MVASGSRTMIAGSLSSCIAGFHQSCRFSQSSGRRRSFAARRRMRTERLYQAQPIFDQCRTQRRDRLARVNRITPTGREDIERRIANATVFIEVALQVGEADMDDHVHPFNSEHSFDDGEGKLTEAKRIEKGKMQSIGVDRVK